MPKIVEKVLTEIAVRNAKPKDKRYDLYDAALRGFGLRVAVSGSKRWFVMRRVNGRMVRRTLGRYPEMGLAEARGIGTVALHEMAGGQMPSRGGDSDLFEAVMVEWLDKDQGNNRSRVDVEGALRLHALPALKDLPIDTIRKRDVLRLLDEVGKTAPVQANRVLAYLRRLFNWCVERDILRASPAAGIKPPTKEISRDRVLSHDELHAIWEAALEESHPWGPMTRMLILTGQRLDEVAGAQWSEIDLDRAVWQLPGARTKNGRPHIVHLSPVAVEVLRDLSRVDGSDWVFTTTGLGPVKGFSKAKKRLDKGCEVTGWTYHDLRRSFATHLTEHLGISPVVTDRILNHVSGAVRGIAAVYQRGEYLDQRKQALEAWGAFVTGLGTNEGNVVPIGSA